MTDSGIVAQIETRLEGLFYGCGSIGALRRARLGLAYPRYALQLALARVGYYRCSKLYSHHTILLFGLPKSGTTWLESMLAEYAGFQSIFLPSSIRHEYEFGETLSYVLTQCDLARMSHSLCVVKIHASASQGTLASLAQPGCRYVILYRDLRDVAVSFVHFVKRRPWHPQHSVYRDLGIAEGLKHFGGSRLAAFTAWIQGWRENRSLDNSLEIRYEDMLSDAGSVLSMVAEHFGLDASQRTIDTITAKYDFGSVGSASARLATSTHFRRGESGGWRKWFTPELQEEYERVWGPLREQLEYPL